MRGVPARARRRGDIRRAGRPHARSPLETARCLFRAAQEALRNVAQHAGARGARWCCRAETAQWTLTIADDGRGFDVASLGRDGEGLGLLVIEERARLLHGTVHVESHSGRGTTVRMTHSGNGALTRGSSHAGARKSPYGCHPCVARGDGRRHPPSVAGGVGPIQLYRRPRAGRSARSAASRSASATDGGSGASGRPGTRRRS